MQIDIYAMYQFIIHILLIIQLSCNCFYATCNCPGIYHLTTMTSNCYLRSLRKVVSDLGHEVVCY